MFNLGGMEILVILVVALLVLGPDKLPNFMRTIGKAVGELRRASTEFQRTINTEIATGIPTETTKNNTPEPHNTPDSKQETPPWEPASAAPDAQPAPMPHAARKHPLPRATRAARARRARSKTGNGPEQA